MPVALDTNILIYAEGLNGTGLQAQVDRTIADLRTNRVLLPAQVLAEFFAVQTRKFGVAPRLAQRKAMEWAKVYGVIDTTHAVMTWAMHLAVTHQIAFWDAIVLASAAEAGCDTLLSEDFQTGFTWRDVTVVSPFKSIA